MTKDQIVDACKSLPIEDMAYVRRALQDMVMVESSRLYRERMCRHKGVTFPKDLMGKAWDHVAQAWEAV